MGRLVVFSSVSLDGFFVDQNGEMGWAHNPTRDETWEAFVASNASGGGLLLFGRKTYQLMENYWPTPLALQNDPVVAERMNALRKVVFSRTLERASWSNTLLVKEGMLAKVREMKLAGEQDMVILGSGSLVSQLTREHLIDEYQLVLIPVILGSGRTLFEGLREKIPFKLNRSRSFDNGNVFLSYSQVYALGSK